MKNMYIDKNIFVIIIFFYYVNDLLYIGSVYIIIVVDMLVCF